MLRRLIVALCVCTLIPLLGTNADAQNATNGHTLDAGTKPPSALTYSDRELVVAIDQANLRDEWIDSAPVSAAASLVEVAGSASYRAGRTEFIQLLDTLNEVQAALQTQDKRQTAVERQVTQLDQLTRGLRRDIARVGRSAALSFSKAQAQQARLKLLLSYRGGQAPAQKSFDPIALAEDQLEIVRKRLTREIELITDSNHHRDKSTDAAISRLTEIRERLAQILALADRASTENLANHVELVQHRTNAIALMDDLHEQRMLAPTFAGGMPVVTLDAYIRAAETLPASCPVDWTLLAGIGRVESHHGTFGDGTVLVTGQVSEPIYGPLLDGGATDREALEALELAAAEEAALAAELAEIEAEAEAAKALFRANLYGLPPEEPASDSDENGFDNPEPEDPETLEAADEDGDGDGETDDDAEQPRGNGFAVIEDSDGGRLDGNDRWDRAVGPMQFIPETWSYFETDGNGDGVADPQNLYDAAATAGQFLCHLSRTRGPSPQTFILGYNSSSTYVRNVLRFAASYAG